MKVSYTTVWLSIQTPEASVLNLGPTTSQKREVVPTRQVLVSNETVPITLNPSPCSPQPQLYTRWSTTLSSKVNLSHAINFWDLCGANLVTYHPRIWGQRNPHAPLSGHPTLSGFGNGRVRQDSACMGGSHGRGSVHARRTSRRGPNTP